MQNYSKFKLLTSHISNACAVLKAKPTNQNESSTAIVKSSKLEEEIFTPITIKKANRQSISDIRVRHVT